MPVVTCTGIGSIDNLCDILGAKMNKDFWKSVLGDIVICATVVLVVGAIFTFIVLLTWKFNLLEKFL